MDPKSILLVFAIGLMLSSFETGQVRGQIFDRLFGDSYGTTNRNSDNKIARIQDSQTPRDLGNSISTLGSRFRDLMSVNVPAIYEMSRNGSSMGINVLSGMVNVERGNIAERNGLNGQRPLSVRVFGIPIFERGMRVRSRGEGTTTDGEPKLDEEPLADGVELL